MVRSFKNEQVEEKKEKHKFSLCISETRRM